MVSLLMGLEFEPVEYAILLDFGNNDEHAVKNGLELAEELEMGQYEAPNQYTP